MLYFVVKLLDHFFCFLFLGALLIVAAPSWIFLLYNLIVGSVTGIIG